MWSVYDGDAADLKKYIKLCQFYHMVQKSNRYAEDVNVLTTMCKTGFDVNYSIPMNSYVCQKQPELLGYTALHFAAMERDDQVAKALLEQGADFTVRNHNGHTALRMAVQIRDEQPFEKLYKRILEGNDFARVILEYQVRTGNTANPACNGGITHFYLACIMNDVCAIEFFLENGASMTDVVSLPEVAGFTALHFAAMFCSYETMKYLLSRGADASIADAKGWTPLHWLMKRRMEMQELENIDHFTMTLRENEEVILVILEKSIADNIMNPIDGIGLSHFHVACTLMFGPTPIVNDILEHVEDVEAAVDLNSPICPGYTPLHFAAAFSKSTVELLVSRGANIAAKDGKGITPFDMRLKYGNNRDVHWMLSQNESLKQVSFSNGSKLLDFVLAIDKYDTLRRFLDFDCDVYISFDSPLWPGYTPLHLAVVFEHHGAVNLVAWLYEEYPELGDSPVSLCVLQYDVNCKARDANNLTPLHLAFKLRNKKLVVQLLKHLSFKAEEFCNINALEGVSFLHIACAIRESADVKRLLQSGAYVNETTKADFVWYNSANETTLVRAGSTPLHILLSLGGFDIVTTLLSLGADPTIRDARGLTSVHAAHILRAPSFVVEQLLSNHTFEKTNAVTRGGLSHLHVACANGAPSTVEEYLQFDSVDVNAPITNVNVMDDHFRSDDENNNLELCAYEQYWKAHAGYTPLYFAVERQDNNPDVIKILLRHGADVAVRSVATKLSPLHRSSKKQDVSSTIIDEETERCMLVLKHLYAHVKEQHGNGFVDDVGWTLLHVACQLRDGDEVGHLLAAGADVNARVHEDSPIWSCDTPLHMVVREFTQTSDLEEQTKTIIRILLEHGADVDAVNSKGMTPLHLAQLVDIDRQFAGKDVCVVDALLAYNSTISLANPTRLCGTSQFLVACGWRNGARTIEEYLDRGVDRRVINRPVDHLANGYTPLHIAATDGSVETVRVLLHHGADIWMEDFLGMTPLHIVAHYYSADLDEASSGRLEKMSTLASFGGSEYLNARTFFGTTTLDLCLENGHNTSAAILLNLGARTVTRNPVTGKGTWTLAHERGQCNMMMENARDITELDETGANALQAIVEYKWTTPGLKVIPRLLDAGCELDHQDRKGRTALHIATKSNNGIALIDLLQSGADVNITDNEHQTVFDIFSPDGIAMVILGSYASAMRSVGLEVCSTILNFGPSSNNDRNLTELNTLQRAFLSEQAIRDFPTMRSARREAIRVAVEAAESMPFTGLLKMQYRRALARKQVHGPAVQQLVQLLDLPELCCENILRYLNTQDVRRLVEPCLTTDGGVAV